MAGRGHVGEGEEEAKANKDHHERREPEVAVVHEGSDLHHIVDDVLEASKLATGTEADPDVEGQIQKQPLHQETKPLC